MSDPLNRVVGRAWLTDAGAAFHLESGAAISPALVAYETYGRLNANRSNAILICHALTGSAHAAGVDRQGRHGWWDGLIGPGRGLDTDRYYIVCSNIIGSCYGSTGPGSTDHRTGAAYGPEFPVVTIRDMVRAQRLLLWKLGVERLHAVVGGSMGGMQALEWSLLFPGDVSLVIPIATAGFHSPWRTAFSSVATEALALGRAAGNEAAGLRLARKIAMLSYRSSGEFDQRFAADPPVETGTTALPAHPVRSYLEHQGNRLAGRFDACSYATLVRAMELHDIRRGRSDLAGTLGGIIHPTLCIGISTDLLYPPGEVRKLAGMIPGGRYREIDSIHGHDAFLIEYDQLNRIIGGFLAGYERAHPSISLSIHPEEYQLP